MSTTDDLDLRLRDWMVSTATTGAPTDPVDRALEAIGHMGQRPGFLVRTPLGLAGTDSRRSWGTVRVAVVALLLLAIVGTTLAVGGRLLDDRRPIVSATPSSVPTWVPTSPPTTSPSTAAPVTEVAVAFVGGRRSAPTLARLADGRILVAGGFDVVDGSAVTLATAEIVDLAARRSTPTGSPARPRAAARAVTLPDGRVVVAGGIQSNALEETPVRSVEIFDPTTGTFDTVQGLSTTRGTCHCGIHYRILVQMRLTLLLDGRVFVSGGQTSASATADVLDPATGTTSTLQLGCNASRGTQTLLADGRVLVICFESSGDQDVNRAVIVDPVSGDVAIPAQPLTGSAAAATLLADGRVLLTGNAASGLSPSAEVYDPAADAWTVVPGTVNPDATTTVRLSDGRIEFITQAARFWAYNPATNAFEDGPALPVDLMADPVDLGDGRMAIVTDDGTGLMTVEVGATR
jgi:hypothetical protein